MQEIKHFQRANVNSCAATTRGNDKTLGYDWGKIWNSWKNIHLPPIAEFYFFFGLVLVWLGLTPIFDEYFTIDLALDRGEVEIMIFYIPDCSTPKSEFKSQVLLTQSILWNKDTADGSRPHLGAFLRCVFMTKYPLCPDLYGIREGINKKNMFQWKISIN